MTTLALVSDAWHPQVNGVVRTLDTTRVELEKIGINVAMITPDAYRTVPMPTYPEIRLTVARPRTIHKAIDAAAPDYVHIATEGPLGMMGRSWCRKNAVGYTTSYHTRFPEYVRARWPVPLSWSYAMVRNFHNAGVGCMVSNATLETELAGRGFRRLVRWVRGVDTDVFNPDEPPSPDLAHLPRPIFMCVGRVSVEKNIKAFLDLELPGTKVVVGDGPSLGAFRARYPDVVFTGNKVGSELTAHYTAADVFVFPSRTDTFGLVVLEALASGLPVAAFPVTGPKDVLAGSGAGALDEDLRQAALAALALDPAAARRHAEGFSWPHTARLFLENLQPFRREGAASVPGRAAAL